MEPSVQADGTHSAAARVLLDQGLAGFVWADRELVVIETEGALAAGVRIGQPVGIALLALFGLDKDIAALQGRPGQRLDIPNIAMATAAGTGPRLNIHVAWDEVSQRYLVVMARAAGQAELERELAEQIRIRQLLEELQLEQAAELERVNKDLTRANRELSEFADIIAHDLNAPLRGLRYHAEDLEQAVAQGNNEEALALAGKLQYQSWRMAQMLSDLLDYARAGRQEAGLERIETRKLIEAIVGSLPRPPGVVLEIKGEWPPAETLVAPLDVVLRNLIDNAIKHHDRPHGVVEISATSSGSLLTITVSDDGPGIPSRLHEAAFLPFRVLAEQGRETGGRGMGLALIRRVVDSVGASIELASDPEQRRGATFRVAWPIKR